MSVSNTVSTTVVRTVKVINDAFQRCKLPPQKVTAEMQDTALRSLYYRLSYYANQGVPLWCIDTVLLGLTQGNPAVLTPAGTVKILNANLRTMNRVTGDYSSSSGSADLAFDGDVDTACTELAPAGNITLDVGTGLSSYVTTIGILPGASGTWEIHLEWSDDGLSWTEYYANSALVVEDKVWTWIDVFNTPLPHEFWRLRAGATTTLAVRELFYGDNNPSNIPMGVLNKDSYFDMPNKVFQGQPLQMWQDRQLSSPVLTVWPAPDGPSQFRLIECKRHRYIMDVGTLAQEIEVPQRWFEFVIWDLAKICALTFPEIDEARVLPGISAMVEETRPQTWSEEVDRSPINIAPNIRGYTR